MSFQILGLGTAVPRYSIEQAGAMEFAKLFSTHTAEQRRLLALLYRRTGVKQRHSVLLDAQSEAEHSQETPSALVGQIQNGSQASAATVMAPPVPLTFETASQSFYPPLKDEQDGGPTTRERMQCYERHATPLARQAARAALEQAEMDGSQVTHLVTVSCTGFQAPGVDLDLIRELPLPAATARNHLGFMGCHGALNGLRLAKAFAEADPEACVLLVAVELCSLHIQYGWEPDRVVANALFADGAAAMVGRRGDRTPTPAHNRCPAAWKVVGQGSLVLPDSEDAMSWRIGDHGFVMTLSPSVPEMIRNSLRPWLAEWLNTWGRSLEEIGSWAIHPGGPRIVSACGAALGLSAEQLQPSRDILARYGNMSSPTVLFILKELMQSQAPRPCVALAFGPGLTIEAMLIE